MPVCGYPQTGTFDPGIDSTGAVLVKLFGLRIPNHRSLVLMTSSHIVPFRDLMAKRRVDAIVVGSGAAGSFAAMELAAHGLEVAILEAGPIVDRSLLDEQSPSLLGRKTHPPRQSIQSLHREFRRRDHRLFVDDVDHPYATPSNRPFTWIRGRQVGGRTLTWTGVTLRLSPLELSVDSEWSELPGWPIDYEEVAPYYSEVEHFLGVHGAKDGCSMLPDGRFLPPKQMTNGERLLKEALEKRWPERRVLISRGVSVEPGLPEQGWPSYTSQGSALDAAFRTGRTKLVPNAVVKRVLTSDADPRRALGVEVMDADTGRSSELHARAVVLAASSLESTRILLNSKSPAHMNGLGNSSDLLGRGLMDHPCVGMIGTVPGLPKLINPPPQRGPEAIVIPRFRNLGNQEQRYVGGFGIFGGVQREVFFRDERVPTHLREVNIALVAYGEMLPRRSNRVTIDANLVDRFGIPSLNISCEWSDNERTMILDMRQGLRDVFEVVGASVQADFSGKVPIPGSMVHELGTARMGRSVSNSVVDRFNRCWDAPNVLVVDGACWPRSGWQNPTLTVMALALRAARFLSEDLTATASQRPEC
jgi:choline dehydrogenase-like flavoprotein